MESSITDEIRRELCAEMQETALAFVRFLQKQHLTLHRDTGPCWKNKIYYWVQAEPDCVCYIAIKDGDEPENHWTVWSDDMGDTWPEQIPSDEGIWEAAWRHIDHCGHCGSCGGGRHKVIFGKEFDDVCGCTFRIDNPGPDDLPFLETMVKIRLWQLDRPEYA